MCGVNDPVGKHSLVTVGCCIMPLGVPDEDFPVNFPGPVEVGSDCDVDIEFQTGYTVASWGTGSWEALAAYSTVQDSTRADIMSYAPRVMDRGEDLL